MEEGTPKDTSSLCQKPWHTDNHTGCETQRTTLKAQALFWTQSYQNPTPARGSVCLFSTCKLELSLSKL